MTGLSAGSTIVRRDVFDGRVWSAQAARVLSDAGEDLVFGYWPGAEGLAPVSWIDGLRAGDGGRRFDAIAELAAREWTLKAWRWRWTNVVHAATPGRWFSVNSFFDAGTGERSCWYVNFERPFVRTARGIDTFDLFVDLVVLPDLTWSWKDEGEYEHACRLGLIAESEQAAVRDARDEVIGLVDSQAGPFAVGPDAWRPDAEWPAPVLPADVERS